MRNGRVYKKDITGDIKGFPIEIVQEMVNRSVRQGVLDATTALASLKRARDGAFSWNMEQEGYDFWEQVIRYRNFDLFFQRYPSATSPKIRYVFVKDDNTIPMSYIPPFYHHLFHHSGKCKQGDLYFVWWNGTAWEAWFALKDSPRARWVMENGVEIK